jgi:hypothetical protein
MKYLRVFNNDTEYQQFKGGGDYITPNVCLNRETKGIIVQPKEKPKLSFPIMLTSKEGTGYNRTVEPNEQTLALTQYINDNIEFDGNKWRIPHIDEFIILDNEITFWTLYGYGSTTWDYFIAHGGRDASWSITIYPNGNIVVYYSD